MSDLIQRLLGGFQAGQQIKAGRLANALGGQLSQPGFDLGASSEFAQLQALDPARAAQIQGSFSALSDDRKKAFFLDMRKGKELLEAGEDRAFMKLMDDRLQDVQRLGGDPSDVMLIRNSFLGNDKDRALSLMGIAERSGVEQGFLSARTAPEKKPFQKAEDGLVFDPNTGTFRIDPVAKNRLDQMAALAKAKGGELDSKMRQSLNKDVTSIIKDTVNISKAASELEALEGRGSAASKLGAVFKFMKSLDPTSVVRETEQGQVYEAQGAGAQLAGMINSMLGEGRLTEAGFRDLVNTSKAIANTNISASRTEVSGLLDTFEDTIPDNFKNRVMARVPRSFELAPLTSSKQHVSSSGITFTVE